jgi:tetratricopeptide (TPR) repeat protein
VELKVRWATALLSVGDTPAVDKARVVLKDVAVANPSHVRGLYLLVQAERTLANSAGAEATARKLIAASPNSVWGQYALAQVFSDRRDYRSVIATLQPIVAGWASRKDNGQGLNVVRLHEQLGLAYQGLEQHDKAVEQFAQARQIAPGDIRVARLEALALREMGQMERGVTLLERVLKQDDKQPAAYLALAELYLEAGRLPQALTVLDRAAAALPGDTAVPYGVGNLLESQKHYAEAERVFKRLLATDPSHVQALNSLGYMLAERGERLEESVEYIKRALEIEPNNPAIIDSLGWAYFKLNQLELAEIHLRKAAAGLVTNSVIQDHLGDTLFKLGNFDEAARAWERALAGDGDSIERATIERKIKSAREKIRKK